MKVTPINITDLKPNEIFVFGSNEGGKHFGGAARLAYSKFGAIMGQGRGLQGQSYAVPTLTTDFEMVSLNSLKSDISTLLDFAKGNKDKHFLITAIGCGIAGFTSEEIAPLFKPFAKLKNCSLPLEFITIISKS